MTVIKFFYLELLLQLKLHYHSAVSQNNIFIQENGEKTDTVYIWI